MKKNLLLLGAMVAGVALLAGCGTATPEVQEETGAVVEETTTVTTPTEVAPTTETTGTVATPTEETTAE